MPFDASEHLRPSRLHIWDIERHSPNAHIMAKNIAAHTLALMVASLGLAEGTTESELNQHLLDKQAASDAASKKADETKQSVPAEKAGEQAGAKETASKADEGTTEERIVALAGDRIQALNADVKTAQTLAASRLADLNAANARITDLEAEVAELGKKAEGEHTAADETAGKTNNKDVPSYMRGALTQRAQKMHSARKTA